MQGLGFICTWLPTTAHPHCDPLASLLSCLPPCPPALLLLPPPPPPAAVQELAADPRLTQRLIASLAPNIWEMDDIKKGVLCQLFGGCSKVGSGRGGPGRTGPAAVCMREHRRGSVGS